MRKFSTAQSVCATTSFIINIDTLYTCKDTYVIGSKNSTPAPQPGARGSVYRSGEKCSERTCNKRKTNDQITCPYERATVHFRISSLLN